MTWLVLTVANVLYGAHSYRWTTDRIAETRSRVASDAEDAADLQRIEAMQVEAPTAWGQGILIGIALVVYSGASVTLTVRRHCGIARRVEGRCPGCGYDLRATRDRCPECGAVPDGAMV